MESVPARNPGARSLVGRMAQANCIAGAQPRPRAQLDRREPRPWSGYRAVREQKGKS